MPDSMHAPCSPHAALAGPRAPGPNKLTGPPPSPARRLLQRWLDRVPLARHLSGLTDLIALELRDVAALPPAAEFVGACNAVGRLRGCGLRVCAIGC
jgi:hypothetical protein